MTGCDLVHQAFHLVQLEAAAGELGQARFVLKTMHDDHLVTVLLLRPGYVERVLLCARTEQAGENVNDHHLRKRPPDSAKSGLLAFKPHLLLRLCGGRASLSR